MLETLENGGAFFDFIKWIINGSDVKNIYKIDGKWSGRSDLNTRHLAPKASALPGCATPRSCYVFKEPR